MINYYYYILVVSEKPKKMDDFMESAENTTDVAESAENAENSADVAENADNAENTADSAQAAVNIDDFVPDESYAESGLTLAAVEARVAAGKINGEQTVRTKRVTQILWSNIFTFFNLVFAVMAVVLVFFVDFNASGIGNFGFMGLVIINATMGIVQELRAKRTMDKLSLISAPKVTVIRGGAESIVDVPNIVLDDLMVLKTGDQICADAEIIDGSIEVNESLITGEPDAILKPVGAQIMSGSCVMAGTAKARVIHIGMDNFAMKISAGAKYFKKPSSLMWRSLMLIVKVMAAIIVPLGAALFCVKYFHHGGELNATVVTTIGSLVGMIPSGLAALSSAVFCVSVLRLSKHKTLAQDMYCVETLARVDVLCLDKTGTITSGEMEVDRIRPKKEIDETRFKQMLKNFITASTDENATALAIRRYVENIEVTVEADSTIPFSSARKWSGAVFADRSYVLGAPEFIFGPEREGILNVSNAMAEKGYRVLVMASSKNKFNGQSLPKALRFEGYVFLTDKIRDEAPATLKFFREQQVDIKIISGDNPMTVRAVAMRAGLAHCDNYIDMSRLDAGADLAEVADKYTIFGRVLPDQKLGLVKALKAKGHTVAMTGDGVNDVLALKEADCSIAMASGSDAAKNVSSLVLLDSNFASLPKVVAEGRRSINNLERSASLYLVKTIYNFLLALIFLIVPYELPFEPKQLTLIGMVTIGIPSFILALEPNNDRVTGRFLPKVLSSAFPGAIMVVTGVVAVLFTRVEFLPNITEEQAQIMYVIVTTFVGFIYLFKVCVPFNVIHVLLCIATTAIFIGCFFVNLQSLNLQELFGLNAPITKQMIQAIVIICLLTLPWFIIVVQITNRIRKKVEKLLDKRAAKKAGAIPKQA